MGWGGVGWGAKTLTTRENGRDCARGGGTGGTSGGRKGGGVGRYGEGGGGRRTRRGEERRRERCMESKRERRERERKQQSANKIYNPNMIHHGYQVYLTGMHVWNEYELEHALRQKEHVTGGEVGCNPV